MMSQRTPVDSVDYVSTNNKNNNNSTLYDMARNVPDIYDSMMILNISV